MAKKQVAETTTPEVIDVGTINPEALEAQNEGQSILSFLSMGKLGAFFSRATELQIKADDSLAQAQAMKMPTSAAEDGSVQKFIKGNTSLAKEVVEHWGITQQVHRFHRILTARRSKAENALEAASKIANRLHNDYVAAEARRVAAENERLRIAAENKARLEREEQQAKLEAAAMTAEESAADLSDREQTFVDLYFSRGDGMSAAKSAGYKNPMQASAQLLTRPKIQAAIKGKREAAEIRRQAAARAAEPLITEDFEPVKAQVGDEGKDRTYYSAELLDEAALIEAWRSGKYGIPADIISINRPALNLKAKDLGELINRWPGVRLKKETKVR